MEVSRELYEEMGGALARGSAYAHQGRAFVDVHDPAEGRVTGTCRGSAANRYRVEALYALSPEGSLEDLAGRCSCPVGFNCKHVVAVLLTALESMEHQGALVAVEDAGAPGTPTRRTAGSAWRSLLERTFPSPPVDPVPLALAVSFSPPRRVGEPRSAHERMVGRWAADYGSPGFLRFRPLAMGKRGRWIVSGATWSKIANDQVVGADPRQVQALQRLKDLAEASRQYLGGSSDWMSVGPSIGPSLWSVLAQAEGSGVALVESESFDDVELVAGVRPLVSIDEDGQGDLRVHAAIVPPLPPQASRPLLLGIPAHGLAWSQDGRIRLGAFTPAGTEPWQRLWGMDTPVVVPARDRTDFERDFLGRIEVTGWASLTETYTPGPAPQPVLRLDVLREGADRVGSVPAAHLHWSWVRHWGAEGGDQQVPIDARGAHALREGAEQASLLAQVVDALVGCGLASSIDRGGVAGAPGRPGQDAPVRGLALVRLLDEGVNLLRSLGVEVVTSEVGTWQDVGVPEVRIGIGARGADWLDLEVDVRIGDTEVPLATLVTALTLGEGAVFLPDGTYARLDDPALDELRTLLAEARDMADPRWAALRVPRSRMSWWEDLLALDVVEAGQDEWFERVRRAAGDPPVVAALPVGLHAQLRPYQREGFEWLAHLRRSGLGGVLADDMGLGKTLQVLAMVLDEREDASSPTSGDPAGGRGPWLVVAPTSVVGNWVSEASRFAPGLRVVAVQATAARRGTTLAQEAAGADVLVTSYALARLESQDYADLNLAGMVLDEAQNAKNPSSQTFSALVEIAAPVVYAVTGTPMENHLGELWAVLALTAPGVLGPLSQFTKNWRRPIENGDDPDGSRMAVLRRRIAPFLLRRAKEDVLLDLPPKQEQVIEVELSPAHRRLYDRRLQRERQEVLHLVGDLEHNRVAVLAALTRLRQLAIDPSLVEEGTTAASSKLDALVPLLEDAVEEGHRILVFSQFTRFLRRIAARLDEVGIAHSYLDGTTPRRTQVIQRFAEGGDPVFLISLKAGGAGINLAMADYAVLVDPWWNPAVEAQAVDRAHRIGQTRPVHVYRLVATGTIEEKVLALQERKRELTRGILGVEEDADAAPAHGRRVVGGASLEAADLRELLA